MTRQDANKRMYNFALEHRGQSVLFQTLDIEERFDYVLLKTYTFFRKAFNPAKSIDRAIANAEAHKRAGYSFFNNETEHLIVLNDA